MPFILLPIVESVHAMEPGENAMLPGMIRRLVLRQHDPPGSVEPFAEGFLWVAQWNGGRVVRYDPDGKVERVVAMPVRRPTSCTFGGPDLSTLYITSGTMRMTAEELAREPRAGHLFALETDVRGLPEPRFAAG